MNADRTTLRRTLTLLVVMTILGFAARLLPYWKEETTGWLFCIWGANAVLPLFMVHLARNRSLFWAYAMPMIGFVVTDLLIQLILQARQLPTSSLSGRLFIYGVFLVLAQLGLVLRYLKLNRWTMLASGVGITLLGSVLFFLFTNFMIWTNSKPSDGAYYYPPTWSGLLYCYELALPFFRNQFLADGFFSAVFFGIFAFQEYAATVAEQASVKA